MQQENSTSQNKLAGRLLLLAERHADGKHTIFAKKADIPASTFQGYLQGRSPHPDHLLRLRETYGVSIDWILSGDGPVYLGEGVSGGGGGKQGTAADEDFVHIPRYEVAASAGGGAIVHSEQVADYLSFRADWVRSTLGVSIRDLALISVIGDSMEPTLSEGDVVLLDMTTKSVLDGSIYALQLNGGLLVKRIQRKLDGSVVVKSDNARYDMEVVSEDKADRLKIIGRVVWVGRRL